MPNGLKKMIQMGLFTALGVTLGYALVYVPNVELVTATVFISGYLLGIRNGIIVGLMTESIFSFINPFGMALPPLFIAQILSMAFTGFLGGLSGKITVKNRTLFHLQFALSGLLATLVFAVLTTLSFVVFTGLSLTKIAASFVYGVAFYAAHVASNTVIFLILVPALIQTAFRAGWFAVYPKTGEAI